MISSYHRFRELTWVDLTLWAGKKIVSDGRECFQRKEVSHLSLTKTGGILAWVEAEERFATRVEYDDGELYSECTCHPIENTCIHAIAVIIEFIVHLKKKIDIPQAESNDRRFFLL
ncbi:MAG: hypothetical protein KAH06_07650 [Desulfobacterales bacterium]|nr:hypothetical protein [Desulfobacterales bacterium]